MHLDHLQEKAANAMILTSDHVRWVIGPSGTVVTFPNEMGLPSIFDPKPCRYNINFWFSCKYSRILHCTCSIYIFFLKSGDARRLCCYCGNCRYPPPREKCAGPSCTNPYKYRDSKSKLPLCSLQCYKAIHEKMRSVSAC